MSAPFSWPLTGQRAVTLDERLALAREIKPRP
jgi:hypothetical protein